MQIGGWDLGKKNLQLHDVWIAFSLLSRIPVPVDHVLTGQRGANAAWAYPVVGIFLGGAAGIMAVIAEAIGLPAALAAAVALSFLVIASGAMHEDGISDFADGLGGATISERLKIMKDSRVGAFGVIALVLSLLMRWSEITEFSGWTLVFTLAAVGGASRAVMVLLMRLMPAARSDGLSASVGIPSFEASAVAAGIALLACVLFTGFSGVVLLVLTFASVAPIYWLAMRNLQGQTGDVLGAAQQFAEIGGLAAAIALMP